MPAYLMTDPTTEVTAEDLLIELGEPGTTDERAARLREIIVEMHRPMARDIARRYLHRGEPMEDLLQAAYVGLMKAINGFDPTLGHSFRGYAMVTMTGEVKRHFRDRTWAVRVPRLYQERRSELNRLVADMTQENGRFPTVAELAERMGISEEDMILTLDASAAYSTLSLDAPMGADDDAAALGDVIPDSDDSLATLVDREAGQAADRRTAGEGEEHPPATVLWQHDAGGDRRRVRHLPDACVADSEEGPRPAPRGACRLMAVFHPILRDIGPPAVMTRGIFLRSAATTGRR